MLTINIQGNGYKVKASEPGTGWRGFSVKARNLAEVHEAIDHYYGTGSKRSHGNVEHEDCPFCRLVTVKVKAS